MFITQRKTFLSWNVAKFGKTRDLGSRNLQVRILSFQLVYYFYNKHYFLFYFNRFLQYGGLTPIAHCEVCKGSVLHAVAIEI